MGGTSPVEIGRGSRGAQKGRPQEIIDFWGGAYMPQEYGEFAYICSLCVYPLRPKKYFYHVFLFSGKRRIPFRFPGFGKKRSIDRMRK